MISLPLVKLWNNRSLIFHFSKLEIKRRYKESYLGFIWSALEPLFIFILLYVVFTSIREPRGENFAIYLITGVMIYHLFTRGTMGGLTSLRGNSSILKSFHIRKELFPVVATGAIAILMFAEVGVFLGLMPVFSFTPTWTLVFFPILIALLLFLILGVSYILSIGNVFATDIQPIWAVFVYALLFASPIFWSLSYVEEGILLEIQKINPVGQLIEIAHKLVFGQIPPVSDWLYTSAFVFGILFIGYGLFQKFEKRATEEL